MTTKFKALAALLVCTGMAACAAGSAESANAAQGGTLAEIILGFWHGIIAPITLVGEIINNLAPNALPWTFRMYETQSTGMLYDIGFFVGVFGGPSAVLTGTSRRRVTRI
jgi:hypothetical protein